MCVGRFVVSGLSTGETYVFRVQAINELGLSEESQESAPITIKAALSQLSFIFTHVWLTVTLTCISLFTQLRPPPPMTSPC